MTMKKWLFPATLMVVVYAMSSCSVTSHPNEKLLYGKWKPEKVERVYTQEEKQKMEEIQKKQAVTPQQQAGTATQVKKTGRGKPGSTTPVTTTATTTTQQAGTTTPVETRKPVAGDGSREGTEAQALARREAAMNRMIQSEQRADLVISEDKTAVKTYPGNPIKATWKLKGNGTVFVAKNTKTKEKYAFDILELTENRAVIQEDLPMGSLKITYVKVK